jgi:hypothetical protein
MRTLNTATVICALLIGLASVEADAATIASWTFETSQPATSGPFAAEIGSGSALGHHASGSAVYSSPAGNGSAHSFSSNTWSVGDYYQFSVSTLGFTNLALSWDQTSSNTGPRDFTLAYSTDGTNFSNLFNYSVLANGSPNPAWNATTSSSLYTLTQNLSSTSALNNDATVYFRLIDRDTVAANGGAVATAGTDRIDNFSITASPVPLPAAVWLLGSGLLGLAGARRRRMYA